MLECGIAHRRQVVLLATKREELGRRLALAKKLEQFGKDAAKIRKDRADSGDIWEMRKAVTALTEECMATQLDAIHAVSRELGELAKLAKDPPEWPIQENNAVTRKLMWKMVEENEIPELFEGNKFLSFDGQLRGSNSSHRSELVFTLLLDAIVEDRQAFSEQSRTRLKDEFRKLVNKHKDSVRSVTLLLPLAVILFPESQADVVAHANRWGSKEKKLQKEDMRKVVEACKKYDSIRGLLSHEFMRALFKDVKHVCSVFSGEDDRVICDFFPKFIFAIGPDKGSDSARKEVAELLKKCDAKGREDFQRWINMGLGIVLNELTTKNEGKKADRAVEEMNKCVESLFPRPS
jgi:hypothetical protein